jgi:tetratricopeptide (TPR) repeat protein
LQIHKNFISTIFEQGLQYHQLGQLDKAKEQYLKVIALDVNNFDSLYLLGMIAVQNDRPSEAIHYLSSAAKINTMHAEVKFNLGVMLENTDQSLLAIEQYKETIHLKPDFYEAYFNLAGIYLKQEKLNDALDLVQSILTNKPTFQQALSLKSEIINHINLLNSEQEFIRNHQNGLAQLTNKKYLKAINSFTNAIKIKPVSAEAHHNLGMTFEKLGQFENAEISYRNALKYKKNSAESYNNLGNILRELSRTTEAIECFENALAIKREYPEAMNNLGWTLYENNRFTESIDQFNKALASTPDFSSARFNLSMANLMQGDFINGWKNYESRKQLASYKSQKILAPDWAGGENINGKTVLVYAEQGMGDTIQFCRYLKHLSKLGAKVIFAPQPALICIFKNLSGVDQVLGSGDEIPPHDYSCLLMSLPYALKEHIKKIPCEASYIVANVEKELFWKKKIAHINSPRIGLVWSGGFRFDQPELWGVNKRRNIPFDILSIINNPKFNFFSLQKGEPAESEFFSKKELFWKTDNLHNYSKELNDYSDTAGLIANLDLVITVDTSTAHLSASMGKPTWILNRFNNCWRWLSDGASSEWYPSVKLFRQKEKGNWNDVITEVRNQLIHHFKQKN